MQGHFHSLSYNVISWLGTTAGSSNYAVQAGSSTFVAASISVGSPTTDGTNGTPGKVNI